MKTPIEILSQITRISIADLEFKNEIELIRPSEALEAMEYYRRIIYNDMAELIKQKRLENPYKIK